MGSLSFSGWQGNLRPLLTHDPTVYGKISLTLCQRALRLVTSTDDVDDQTNPLRLCVFIAPARLYVLVHQLWLCT
jgi:hypothetical protein